MLADKRHMNFFWGGERMSWLRFLTLYSFCKLNPDWRVTLYRCPDTGHTAKYWTCPNCQDFFAYRGPDYSDRVGSLGIEVVDWKHDFSSLFGPSHLSNLFKWQLLATSGGWYADLDILWVRPMASYLPQIADDEQAAICHQLGYFSIGLLASVGGVEFFDRVLAWARDANARFYQSAGTASLYRSLGVPDGMIPTGPNGWELLQAKYPDLKVHNFPMDVVYPWTCTEMAEVFTTCHKTVSKQTIGIHWYAGNELSQQFNGEMTEQNFRSYDNTIAYFIQKVIDHDPASGELLLGQPDDVADAVPDAGVVPAS